jgi:hypothetical protein
MSEKSPCRTRADCDRITLYGERRPDASPHASYVLVTIRPKLVPGISVVRAFPVNLAPLDQFPEGPSHRSDSRTQRRFPAQCGSS